MFTSYYKDHYLCSHCCEDLKSCSTISNFSEIHSVILYMQANGHVILQACCRVEYVLKSYQICTLYKYSDFMMFSSILF